MSKGNDDTGGLRAMLMARSGVLLGVVGMVAWLALLWAMFGDVL